MEQKLLKETGSIFGHLPAFHRILLVLLLALMLLVVLLPTASPRAATVLLPLMLEDPLPPVEEMLEDTMLEAPQSQLFYEVRQGDTLSAIFERLRLPQATLYQLLEADLNVLALDTIQPGHRLEFAFDPAHRLTRFTFKSGLTYRVEFHREDKEDFEVAEHIEKGEMRSEVFVGTVQGNLHLSMQQAGTSLAEAYSVTNLLKERMNFRRDLRAGDRFQLVLSRQYVDGQHTGNSTVEGFRYIGSSRELSLFLFDGNYFDAKGQSLEKAFQRIPLNARYRMSSGFNPRRLHPVTGTVRPHNGTDFATPIGTPVVAAGDGVVTRVISHRFAGLYVEIEHGTKYRSRYLHLKQAYVRKGQRVSRGQKIALTGNSGRSTGPHLHYELHVNGRPVDPMKAPIPEVKSIPASERNQFRQRVAELSSRMEALTTAALERPGEDATL